MKKFLLLVLSFLFLTIASCSKKDSCEDPVDCLPPLTQTGENTVGCLINGKPFRPGGSQLGGPTLQAFYQYSDGGYHLGIVAINNNSSQIKAVSVGTSKLAISEKTFSLLNGQNGQAYGRYIIGSQTYNTTDEITGQLKISNFDEVHGIISGTFWFDAIDEEGELVEIREGRFDVKYY